MCSVGVSSGFVKSWMTVGVSRECVQWVCQNCWVSVGGSSRCVSRGHVHVCYRNIRFNFLNLSLSLSFTHTHTPHRDWMGYGWICADCS